MYFGLSNGRRFALGAAPRAVIDPAIQHPGTVTTTAQSPENAQNQALEGYGTSDGRLIWSGNAWRVVSNDSITFAGHVTQTAKNIVEAGYPIFIGPIPWGINGGAFKAADLAINSLYGNVFTSNVIAAGITSNAGVQITTLTDPVQIPKGWGDWFAGALDAVRGKDSKPDLLDVGYYPWYGPPLSSPYYSPLASLVLGVDGYLFQPPGKENPVPTGCCDPANIVCGTASNGFPRCDCSTDWNCRRYRQSTAEQPVTAISGPLPDANGFPAEWVKYATPNDVYTYKWIWIADWLESMKKGLSTKPNVGRFFKYLTQSDQQLAHQMFDYDPTLNIPPLAKFRHPITGDTWGVWFVGVPNDSSISLGAWSTAIDSPNGIQLKIGIGPIPQEPWYDYIVDALEWIPEMLGTIASDILGAIRGLICSNPAQAAALAGKDPRLLAAMAAFKATCPQPPTTTINCLDPTQAAINPICKPAVVTPWYLQWYVIVGVISAVGLGIISAKKSRNAPTNP